MRAQFEDVPWTGNETFVVRSYDLPNFSVPWHFHPELELTLILEGGGDRCVGDHLERFTAGDLVLLGPELPHYWHSRAETDGSRARAIVVHFRQEAFGAAFFDLPELRHWQQTLQASRRGLHFHDPALLADVNARLSALHTEQGGSRLLVLWAILDRLSSGLPYARPLAGEHYVPTCDHRTSDRLGRVYEYLYAHLHEPLTLQAVAACAGMTGPAFSRYFKRVTGRTLTRLINELRITQVCKQLIDTDRSITEIAFAAGFQSISNFNRAFLDLQTVSPQNYRNLRRKKG